MPFVQSDCLSKPGQKIEIFFSIQNEQSPIKLIFFQTIEEKKVKGFLADYIEETKKSRRKKVDGENMKEKYKGSKVAIGCE